MDYRIIALMMLALVSLTACPGPPSGDDPGIGPVEPEPIRVEVKATEKEGHIEIHEEHHEAAIVGPGQQVEWACLCDDGLEFTVADLRPVVDLEHLTDPDLMKKLEVAMKGDSEAGVEGRLQALDALAPAFFMAPRAQYQAEENAIGPPDVTGGWSSGVGENEFTDGTFVSPRVPRDIGHILWKFTWKVRRQGDPASVAEWDPHIETHPGISAF